MGFSSSFLEAWINAPATILGRRLQPFSLRHLLWLYALESPFVKLVDGQLDSTAKLRISDLRVFVAVCASNTDAEVYAHLQSWRWKHSGWRASTRRKSWPRAAAYIRDHVTAPTTLETGKNGRLLGAPWVLRTVCRLCRNGIGSANEVWQMPVGKAMWYSATCDELDGGLTLGDAEFENFMQEARGLAAQ